MSVTPKKPCRKCKRVLTRETYCPACELKLKALKKEKSQRYDTNRGTTTERGYGADWVKVRSIKLSQNPLCECNRCKEMGRILVADTVHHVEPVETHPELRLDIQNLESMSHRCHEVEERRAIDTEYEEWKKWKRLSA